MIERDCSDNPYCELLYPSLFKIRYDKFVSKHGRQAHEPQVRIRHVRLSTEKKLTAIWKYVNTNFSGNGFDDETLALLGIRLFEVSETDNELLLHTKQAMNTLGSTRYARTRGIGNEVIEDVRSALGIIDNDF